MKIDKQLLILCVAGLMLSACSQTEKPTPVHFSISTTEVCLTKKGVDVNNRNFVLCVTSDTYWVAIPDKEENPWLRLSTRAGAAGETRIELSADENYAPESRETFIRFETAEAVVQRIRVREAGSEEMLIFLHDGFGEGENAGTPIDRHVNTAEGFSVEEMFYSGTECLIGSAPESSGYAGASGGCHAALGGACSELRVNNLNTYGGTMFHLAFGACGDHEFDCRKLVLSIRLDDGEWMFVPYTLSAGRAEGWNKIGINLLLTEPCEVMALRFYAADDGYYRIDDILLQEAVLGPNDFYYTEGDLERFDSEEWKWDDPSDDADCDGTENFGNEDYTWE